MLTSSYRFLADRFVEGICPHCGFEDARGDQCDGCSRTLDAIELVKPRCLVDKSHVVTTRTSSHMYLKLDVIQPRTEEWIKQASKAGKWHNAVINSDGEIVDARMKKGLLPTPLTRDLKWGVPVPIEGEDIYGMAGKVLCTSFFQHTTAAVSHSGSYRCLGMCPLPASQCSLTNIGKFDAPIGYPSITANYFPEWEKWWFNPENVDLYQFMGKDNVYFHAVYFPSVEIGDGRNWTKVHHLSTTGTAFSKLLQFPSHDIV